MTAVIQHQPLLAGIEGNGLVGFCGFSGIGVFEKKTLHQLTANQVIGHNLGHVGFLNPGIKGFQGLYDHQRALLAETMAACGFNFYLVSQSVGSQFLLQLFHQSP